MDGSEHRLRRSHALKRQHETGIRFAGAHRPLTPWIGVVGERGEQRRPPAVVGVRHLPVRPCTRGPPGLDSEGVAAQRIGRSGRRAHDELVGVGFQGWGPERRKESAPWRVPALPISRPASTSTPIGPWAGSPARRRSTPPARDPSRTGRTRPACSRRRPPDCRRRQHRVTARWRRCPRASTSLRWTVDAMDPKRLVADGGGEQHRTAVGHPDGPTTASPGQRGQRRGRARLATSITAMRRGAPAVAPLDDDRAAVGRPAGQREVDDGPLDRICGVAVPPAAGSVKTASARRSAIWIGADDRRAVSSDVRVGGARFLRHPVPPAGTGIHNVDVRLQRDTAHQVELVEHQTIPGQADGAAEVPLRDHARRRSAGRQDHQRREVVRRHRRVEEMTIGAEARRGHAESLVRQPHRAVWRRRRRRQLS